jgi:hypothetical protein
VAGGFYPDKSGSQQVFVDAQNRGRWATAVEAPGSGALNAGGTASMAALACASPGNCAAGGYYTDHAKHEQAFVVSQVKGTWGRASIIPGLAALSVKGLAALSVKG